MNQSEKSNFQHLGRRVYLVFVSERIGWFILNLIAIVLIYLISILVPLPDSVPAELLANISLILFALLPITLAFALITAWLQYMAYEFFLDENSFKIKRGIIGVQIEAIPYRQIQDVHVQRDLWFRIFGLSKLIILTAGTEDAGDPNDESKGIIPAMDQTLALQLQEELLKRANIEKTTQVNQ